MAEEATIESSATNAAARDIVSIGTLTTSWLRNFATNAMAGVRSMSNVLAVGKNAKGLQAGRRFFVKC